METDILAFVLQHLEATRGSWPTVADESGVSLDTIRKIAQRQTEDPKVGKVQKLANYFRDRQVTA